jgi:uncharacterized protein
VADFLRSLEAKRAAKPLYGDWSVAPAGVPAATPSDATIEALREQGYLTEFSCDEEETFFGRLATALHERAARQSPSYIFMPSYDCNLRCSYCYQDHMRSDCSFHHLLRTMRPAMIDRIFAALPQIEARHGLTAVRRRNIGLFGGEPLLAAHRSIIEHLLEKAFETAPDSALWAVTNGTEIDAYRDLLGPAGIARLQITLDGPPEKHDQKRIYADGSGSYERIAENITMALEAGAEVSIRLNIDRANLGDLPEIAAEIIACGWDRHPRFSAYTSPVRPGNGKTDRASTLSSWELDRELAAMREEHPELRVISRPDEGLKAKARRIFDTRGEILPSLRPSFCSAHDRMYIFDSFGDIYGCWERTGNPSVRLGCVTPEGGVELAFDQIEAWRTRTVASNPVCRRCRYALHCGGGCAVLALEQNGKLHSNYCDGFAARFRANVAEAFLEHAAGVKPEHTQERVCDL